MKRLILPILLTFIVIILFVSYKYYTPDQLFFSTTDYPEIKHIENNYKLIADEIPPFDETKKYKKRSRTAWNNSEALTLSKSMKSEWVRGWMKDKFWYNFPLIYKNNVIADAEKICPNTIKLLKKFNNINIAGFAILKSKAKLKKHTDLTGPPYNSMAVNLMLTNNKNTNLYINDETYTHKQGKAVIFDSTIQHYADNLSKKNRVVLYVDFKTDTLYGRRIKGFGLASSLGYPTINLYLIGPIKAGAYTAMHHKYGKVIVFINNANIAECHFLDFDNEIDKKKNLFFTELKKIDNHNSDSIVSIFNKGVEK
jgi:hypothetical protein